jgi:hypothetical protein
MAASCAPAARWSTAATPTRSIPCCAWPARQRRRALCPRRRRGQDWGERNVSRPDGSWVNDVFLNDWKGTTVFRAIALSEALLHHGDLLDAKTRRRLARPAGRAYAFLRGFITMETGNINYPVSAAYAFSLGAEVLERPDYEAHARELAHACLDYFTPNNLLFGEGHPQRARTPKGRPPVDLGYNVEESLPALAMYALRPRTRRCWTRCWPA